MKKEVSISITWHKDDVIERAQERDIILNDDQACDILQIMKSDHDCSIGINWDVIDVFTDLYLKGYYS